MNKIYNIYLDDKLIGTTRFEKADAPMGIVFGEIKFSGITTPYDFFKSYCAENNIGFDDSAESKTVFTRTIPTLKILNDQGKEIKGVGNQICGMDSDIFELIIEGISYPFYEEEFPHHVKDYEKRFS
jgi:hypothetical protein